MLRIQGKVLDIPSLRVRINVKDVRQQRHRILLLFIVLIMRSSITLYILFLRIRTTGCPAIPSLFLLPQVARSS